MRTDRKWKQPIYYEFDKPVDRDIFINIVKTIELTGFRVRVFVSDMGSSNLRPLSDLEIKPGCSLLKFEKSILREKKYIDILCHFSYTQAFQKSFVRHRI